MSTQWRRQFASLLLIVTLSVAMISVAQAATAPPNILSYQGRLLNANGVPVTSATASMKFKLYDSASAGTCLWSNSSSTCATETARTVTLSSGLFSENLGDTGASYAAIPNSVFADNQAVYLGITIGADTEMTPRKRMTAAPYALNAQTLDGIDSTSFLQTGTAIAGASPLVFEGATDDTFETTFAITDPTADNTITFKNASGTVAFLSDIGGVTADSLDFTDFADSMTLDAATTIAGNILSLNANSNFAVNINTGTSAGALSLGGGSGTVAINSSDWDIDATGAITGVSFDANGSGNSLSNIENADIAAAAGIVYSKLSIADSDLTIAKTSGLQSALDGKLSLAGGTLTGDVTFGDTVPDSAKAIFDPGLGDTWNVYASSTGLHFDVNNSGATTMSLSNTNVGTTNLAVEGAVYVQDGGVAGPTFSFTNDQDTGMYRIGSGNLGISSNSTKILDIGASGLSVTGTVSATDVSCTDCLDFAELADAMALDAATSITGTAGETFSLSRTASPGLNEDGFELSFTAGVEIGSNTQNAFDISVTNTDHSGASNILRGLNISGITGDGQATENAIEIGSGWDHDLVFNDLYSNIQFNGSSFSIVDSADNSMMGINDTGSVADLVIGGDFSITTSTGTFEGSNLDTNGAGTLSIGKTAATTINIGENQLTSKSDTINIATESTGSDTISIGNSNASTTVAITGGNDWSISTGGVITGTDLSCTDCLDFAELADAMTLDAATTITGTSGNVFALYRSATNATDENGMNLTFVSGIPDGNETYEGLNISVTSTAGGSGSDNILTGLNIDSMLSAQGSVSEDAFAIGVSWDRDLVMYDLSPNINIQAASSLTFQNLTGTSLLTLNGTSGDLGVKGDLVLTADAAHVIKIADQTGVGAGSALSILGEKGGAADVAGGNVSIIAGQGGTNTSGFGQTGGGLFLTGGAGGAGVGGGGSGGQVTITGGDQTGGNSAGDVVINAGSGQNGDVTIGTTGTSTGVVTLGNSVGQTNIYSGESGVANWSIVSGLFTTTNDIALNGGDLTSTAGTFNFLDQATTKTIDIGGVTTDGVDTIRIATNNTSSDSISIGNTAITTSISLTSGLGGGVYINDTAGTNKTYIGGNGGFDGTDTVQISTDATSADTITIGNANAATAFTLTGGTAWSISSAGALTVTSCSGCSGGGFADGTVGAPSIMFSSDTGTNTGFYRIAEDNIGVATNGVKVVDIGATTIDVGVTTSTTLNLGAGGALTRAINIGTGTGADTISIGGGATGADVINIGNNTTNGSTIVIGGTNYSTNSITIGADLWKITSGTAYFGGIAATSTAGTVSLYTNLAAGATMDFVDAVPTLNIQKSSGTHALNIGGTGADTIAIASGSAATADTLTIGNTNIGTTLALTGGDDWSITTAGLFTTASDLVLTGGEINVSMLDGQTTTIDGDGSPTVNLFQIGSGDTASTLDDTNVLVLSMDYNNVDGSYILVDTPVQIDANGSDRFRALEVEPFTFATTSTINEFHAIDIGTITVTSNNTGQIVNGLKIGNVSQDTTGNIAANAVSIGTGWDAEINFSGTAPKIAIGATGTLSVTDGTNVLLDVIDDGTVGRLSVGLNGTATTNGLCHSGANLDAASSAARDIVVCSGAPGDYAEWHETDGTVQSGDIVSTTNATFTYSASESNAFTGEILAEKTQKILPILTAATANQSEKVLGVVSTSPNQTIGSDVRDQGAHPQPIALVGRVPVNVTNENGSIQVGDYITTSTTPGKGMKATYAGRVIGIALTGMNGASGQVTVQVTNSWYFGSLIGNDGTSTLLTDNVVVAPIGNASASTQTFDSYGLALRGSAWDGNQAQAVSMMFKNKVTDGTNYRLSVRNTLDSEVAYITNTGTMQVAGDMVVGGKIYPSNLGGIQTDKYIYYDGSAGPGGDFMRTNASGWSTGSYDFAEMFPSSEALVAGDVVVFSSTNIHVKRSTKKEEKSIAGIVSTRPGFLAGENTPGSYPIALAGRVPTNVNNENGAIAVGDPLTTSSASGVAMKATEAGPIVGYALEPFDGTEGSITVFVSAGYWGGDATSSTPGADNRASLFGSSGNSSMSTLSMGGNINMNGNEISNIGRMSGLTNSWSIEMDGTIKTEALLKTVIIGQNNQKVETIATTSPEAVITLSGSSTLKEGMAEVRFFEVNKDFGNVISAVAPIRVVATPNGPVSLYVSEKDQNHFIVKSFGGNASDVEFDWVVTGYRKGFEPVVEEATPIAPASIVQPSAPSVTHTENVDSIETTIPTSPVTENAPTSVVADSQANTTPSEVPASSSSASTTTVDPSVTNVDASAPTLSP